MREVILPEIAQKRKRRVGWVSAISPERGENRGHRERTEAKAMGQTEELFGFFATRAEGDGAQKRNKYVPGSAISPEGSETAGPVESLGSEKADKACVGERRVGE